MVIRITLHTGLGTGRPRNSIGAEALLRRDGADVFVKRIAQASRIITRAKRRHQSLSLNLANEPIR